MTIESLSYFGGRGVGRHDGMVVFVPGTAPGDRVRVRITERKPRFCEAELIELLELSPHRREPPCPVVNRCGGCAWQHVTYEQQVEQKQKILRDSLRRLSGFKWLPFIAAPDEFHYRNRIQLQVQGVRAGFFAKRSRDLVEIERCWIAEPALNEKLINLTAAEKASARRLELALLEGGEVNIHSHGRDPEAALFSQVNRAQNKNLISLVLDLAAGSPDWIMDLYAGAGNLTLPLAAKFPGVPVTGVELSRASIVRARARDPLLEWIAGDVSKVLKGMEPRRGYGLIVLDPPRAGCERAVLDQVTRHAPARIIYVSCNPSTFARDAERLSNAYRLESVQGLDMFPQTEHVELVGSFCAAR